jgi:transposase
VLAKRLRRRLGEAIRWRQRQAAAAVCARRRQRLQARLQALIDTPWANGHARRWVKRLRRHAQELVTFLDDPEVPFDNNHAERTIRPAVIIRTNSYANGSEAGADLQAVLMSVSRTLKQRGHHPIQTMVAAIRTYLQTGSLPPLPAKITVDG